MTNSASESTMPEQDQAEQKDPRLLESIALENLLSYGPGHQPFKLTSLNVLIGPNGSGKSNLIEAFTLVRSTTRDIGEAIRKGGGVREWIWKGGANGASAGMEVVLTGPEWGGPLRHYFLFSEHGQRYVLDEEVIADAPDTADEKAPQVYFKHRSREARILDLEYHMDVTEDLDLNQSVLSQHGAVPGSSSERYFLSSSCEKIRIYRDWSFGRNTIFRQPQAADMRNDRLEEDFSNLGLFLNRLRRIPAAKRQILERLQDLYEGLQDFDVSVEGGTVQLFLQEEDFIIPATRLSDGTLRYLCLLAILCDPEPPPLICIEEPELGLHPDIIPKIADLLVEASERTQLIVTTHSDILVDALTETPESIVICEKHEGQTQLKRLDRDELEAWLKDYRLGELWTRGELGGTRW